MKDSQVISKNVWSSKIRVTLFRSIIFRVVHFPGRVFSSIFQCVTFLPFSVSCNFRSTIFRVVQFPFCHFPGCVFSAFFQCVHFLPFSVSCIFRSIIFQVCIFYHFPVCAFSTIFRVVQFPFYHFPWRAFSVLSFSIVCALCAGDFEILRKKDVHFGFCCEGTPEDNFQ